MINLLRELQLDLNDVFILECYDDPEEKKYLDKFQIPSIRDFNISTRHQALKREEYLVEDPNDSEKVIISVKGKNLLEQLHLSDPIRVGNVSVSTIIIDHGKTPEEQFDEWWKAYPSSNTWKSDDGTKTFTGSRNFKNIRKPLAKQRYLKLLNQGYKHEDLVGSLLYEVKLKKLDSVKTGLNKMDYFKGMDAYLNQETYLSFVDNYRDNPSFVSTNVEGKKLNVTDI